jgi:hypothetical protein
MHNIKSDKLIDDLILASCDDWYKEGSGDWSKAILSAILLVMMGYSPLEAAQKMNVKKEDVQRKMSTLSEAEKNYLLNNRSMDSFKVPEIPDSWIKQNQTAPKENQSIQKENKVNMSDFITHLLKHEGLETRQTPIRITFKHMRNWDTILGYPVYKGAKPPERQNFFYVKNPNDVKPLTTQVFLNYLKDPLRWRLPRNPTIGQAIRVFDQSGASDKIAYLKKAIPNFNENAPLKSLL